MVPRRCYEGVQRDGELIRVRDTVLLKSGPRKKTLPYVAKISALWEEPETGEKQNAHTVSVRCKRGFRITFSRTECFSLHRRANDEFVLVLPSRAYTGGTQP